MQQQLVAAIAALSMLAAFSLRAQEPGQHFQELENVLIVGEQPGPGLWKLSKGDHVMWVLSSYQPLPGDMIWRSRTVEARPQGQQAPRQENAEGCP
jgi:hypothetical protein